MGEKAGTNRIQRVLDTKGGRVTQYVVIGVAVALVLFDIYLYVTPEGKDTISAVIFVNAVRGPLFVLSWAWGVMSSHLFIARPGKFKTVPEGIAIFLLILIGLIIYLLGYFVPFDGKEDTLNVYMHITFLVVGGVCGYFLWPQELRKE